MVGAIIYIFEVYPMKYTVNYPPFLDLTYRQTRTPNPQIFYRFHFSPQFLIALKKGWWMVTVQYFRSHAVSKRHVLCLVSGNNNNIWSCCSHLPLSLPFHCNYILYLYKHTHSYIYQLSSQITTLPKSLSSSSLQNSIVYHFGSAATVILSTFLRTLQEICKWIWLTFQPIYIYIYVWV